MMALKYDGLAVVDVRELIRAGADFSFYKGWVFPDGSRLAHIAPNDVWRAIPKGDA